MKKVLVLAAVSEAATGVADCPVVGRAIAVRRRTDRHCHDSGARDWPRLIALGVACWPGPPLVGMLIYSASVALYLAYVGFAGGLIGDFLWPAVVLHVILTALLARDVTRTLRGPFATNPQCPQVP